MNEGHSQFGGSIASRWMNCPGSVALCASVPALPDTEYSGEGSKAHSLAAYCLEEGYTFVVSDLIEADMPADMVPAVEVYLDAVYAEMKRTDTAELYVEQKFVFAEAGNGKDVYGANDAIVYHPSTGRLVVFDYKHGVGVAVSAEDNAQLKFYAAGAVLANPTWSISEIWLCIVQPRSWNKAEGEEVSFWQMDTIEVIEFAAEIEVGVAAAKAIMDQYAARAAKPKIPDPLHAPGALNPGSWCRYSYQCDAAAVCPAKERATLDALTLKFNDAVEGITMDNLLPPHTIATDTLDGAERIGRIIAGVDVLTAWANQVREYAESHMLAGNLKIPGWKVVEKIGRRKWVSADEEIVGFFELQGLDPDLVAPRKVVTITEAEKLLKAEGLSKEDRDSFFLSYTIKESSGATIAPESDRRQAIDVAALAIDGITGNFGHE